MMFLCCINFIVPHKTFTWQNFELVNERLVFILIRKIRFVIQMRKGNELNAYPGKSVLMCQFGFHRVDSKHHQ